MFKYQTYIYKVLATQVSDGNHSTDSARPHVGLSQQANVNYTLPVLTRKFPTSSEETHVDLGCDKLHLGPILLLQRFALEKTVITSLPSRLFH